MNREILWRRNNKYKKEFEEYLLNTKVSKPYKYNRFYELRQDYSYEEVLVMERVKSNRWGGRRKISELLEKRLAWSFAQWYTCREVQWFFWVSSSSVYIAYSKYKKWLINIYD